MNIEVVILTVSIFITVVLPLLLIKRRMLLEALVSFTFMQTPTWLFGAVVVEERLIQYPAAEAALEHYTKIIDCIDWRWEYSMLSMNAALLLSYWYYRWFFGNVMELR